MIPRLGRNSASILENGTILLIKLLAINEQKCFIMAALLKYETPLPVITKELAIKNKIFYKKERGFS